MAITRTNTAPREWTGDDAPARPKLINMVHLFSKRTADKLSDRSLAKIMEIVKFTLRYRQIAHYRTKNLQSSGSTWSGSRAFQLQAVVPSFSCNPRS
jgi:hypothetical protein